MIDLKKAEVEQLLRIENVSGTWFGKFNLSIPSFGTNIEVIITLEHNSNHLTDRTIQLIHDVANLTEEHYNHVMHLLFEDAMRFKQEVGWYVTNPAPAPSSKNWLRRLFSRPGKSQFIELPNDDHRHPMFGIKEQDDIEAHVKWDSICINDAQDSSKRVAFLTCYPEWEKEHGREIAICNGVPVAIGDVQLNEYSYQDF